MLKKWATEQEIEMRNVAVQKSVTGALGLFATKSIGNHVILHIPHDSLINKSKVSDSNIPVLQECFKSLKDAPARIFLVVYFTYLRLHVKDDYSQSLPAAIECPLIWDPESVEYMSLEGTGLDTAIQAKKSALKKEYQIYIEAMNILGAGFEDFIWAEHMVMSRSMEHDGLFIAPIIDFCNHSLQPNAWWSVNEAGIDLNPIEGVNIPSGGEILISYGDKPNQELLFLHGFCLPLNTFDQVSFHPPIFELSHRDENLGIDETPSGSISEKKILIQRYGFSTILQLQIIPKEDDNASRGLLSNQELATLYLCMLTFEQGFTKTLDGYKINGQLITSENFIDLVERLDGFELLASRAWTILLQMVQERLENMQQQLEDDLQHLNKNVEFVQILREGCSAVLTHVYPIVESLQAQYLSSPVVAEFLNNILTN